MPTDTLCCWNCGTTLDDVPRPVSRHEYCPHCAEPVHCCRMCVHFEPSAAGQCREDRAEPPADRTAANFCDFFTLREAAAEDAGSSDDAARARLQALFGTAANDPAGREPDASRDDHDARQDAARTRLDELFGKDPDDA